MLLFVELCVHLKKGKLAKDGLYQYKNTAQNTNVGTIEVGCRDAVPVNLLCRLTLTVMAAGPQKVHRTCGTKGYGSTSQS